MTKLVLLAAATIAFAQAETVGSGATLVVRTNETIKATKSGQVHWATVDQTVRDRNGRVVIPRGAPAQLVVRRSGKELMLDLEAVNVNGRRYALAAEPVYVGKARRKGVGGNKRTGKFVGGGAALGTVVGAIAGGGVGAAVGAASGAAVGAGAQTLTRGKSVKVPAESQLAFRLQRPLQVEMGGNRYPPRR